MSVRDEVKDNACIQQHNTSRAVPRYEKGRFTTCLKTGISNGAVPALYWYSGVIPFKICIGG